MPVIQKRLGRSHALAIGLGTTIAARGARAATPPITDAVGRTIELRQPAERIVLDFHCEEFTAITGPAGWDRVVGFAKTLWSGWRRSVFERYLAVISWLAALPDVGNSEENSFSVERVLPLRRDLVVLPAYSIDALGQQVKQMEVLGIPVLVIDYNAEIPERHAASTLAMGMATGNEECARARSALYLSKLADIARRVATATTRPKAYFEFGQGAA